MGRSDSVPRIEGPLGDRRGLTAAGALVLLLAFGGFGALLDRLLGHGFWIFFAGGFVAAVLVSSLRIHLEDLAASIVLVPLTYGAAGTVSGLVSELGSGAALREQLVTVAGVLVLGAPVLMLSLVAAVLIAATRARATTVARRRARARAVHRHGALPPGCRPRRSAADQSRARRP